MTIPLFDGRGEFEASAYELEEAALRALRSGRYILGPEVEAFERQVADHLGARHAVGCASGTDALWLALRALGIGRGDLVATTALSFFATASAILNCGARPVFCDIEPDTFTLDPRSLRDAVEGQSAPHRRLGIEVKRIKAVVVVHLYGQPADMEGVGEVARRLGLPVVEDAAQAFGAPKVGTLGTFGCFSFFPTKNLGGFGDGGCVTTEDDELAARVRELGVHGAREKYVHARVGTNSRLDELQAALLRVRLRHVDASHEGRRAAAELYAKHLNDLPLVGPADRRGHTYNSYVLRLPEGRDRVRAYLAEHGVATAIHYPAPLHLQDAVRELDYRSGDFPEAERACREVLTLPMYPSLAPAQIERIGGLIGAALGT